MICTGSRRLGFVVFYAAFVVDEMNELYLHLGRGQRDRSFKKDSIFKSC